MLHLLHSRYNSEGFACITSLNLITEEHLCFLLLKNKNVRHNGFFPFTFPVAKLKARVPGKHLSTPLASFKASCFCSIFGRLTLLHFIL